MSGEVSYPARSATPRTAVFETPGDAPPGPAPPPDGAPYRPRLLDLVRETIRTRHYSPRTEEAYVGWIRRFVLFHGRRHPVEMAEPEISRFLSYLAVDGRVSATTQTQALSALLFLYRDVLRRDVGWGKDVVRAKAARRLPVVMTRDEVRAVLNVLDGENRLVATLLYGAGLRLLEALRLRVQDLEFGANQIVVRDGKGQKDRRTMLPGSVKQPLQQHLEAVHLQHQHDLGRGAGWVEVPTALGRKYPNAGREWAWHWVFPATRTYVCRETRQRRRHHLHESVVQRAVHFAVRQAGLTKPASCHTFRHNAECRIMPSAFVEPQFGAQGPLEDSA